MSTVWGNAYCWPLLGTTASCLNNSHLLGLPDDETKTAAASAGDQAEKTDQENEMEKWICKEVLGENLSPLNLLDRCLITFSHYQTLTSKPTAASTSSVDHTAKSFSVAPEPATTPSKSHPLIPLPSSRSLFRPFCPGGASQKSSVDSKMLRLGASRMGMRRKWRSTYHCARG